MIGVVLSFVINHFNSVQVFWCAYKYKCVLCNCRFLEVNFHKCSPGFQTGEAGVRIFEG